MALDRLTKIDGGGISTTSNYRVGIITASKFIGPFDGTGGNFSGVVTATNGVFSGNISAVDGNFSGNVTIGGTLTYEDVTNIDSVGLITARNGINVSGGNVTIAKDLDVDGHTELDNVSVAGVSTFSSSIGSVVISEEDDPSLTFISTSGIQTANRYRLKVGGGRLNLQVSANNGASYVAAASMGGIGNIFIPDNDKVYFGTNNDAYIVHDNSNLNIINTTGNIDVTGNLHINNQISVAGVSTFSEGVFIPDNKELKIGNNGEIEIFRSGTESAIVETQGNNLSLAGNRVNLLRADRNTVMIQAIANGPVELYHNNALRLTTSSVGVSIPQDLDVDGHTNLDNVSIAGVSTFTGNADFSNSIDVTGNVNATGNLDLTDSGRVMLGTGDDLQIYHTGSASKIDVYTTGLEIATDGTETLAKFNRHSSVELWHDGTKRFETTNQGINVIGHSELDNVSVAGVSTFTGAIDANGDLDVDGHTNLDNVSIAGVTTFSGHLLPNTAGAVNIGSASAEIGHVYLADGKNVYLGSDQDMTMGFDSSNALISLNTGTLSIINYANNEDVKILSDNGGGGVVDYIVADGSTGEVLLNHYGSQKLATSTTGISVTGEVATSQDYPDFEPVLNFNFAGSSTQLDPRLLYRRSGVASFVDANGLVKIVGENTPRFDHDPISRKNKGILIEHSRTNVAESSEDFGNTSFWVPTSQTIITNVATAPDGTLTADNIIPASGNAALRYLYFSGSAYPMSANASYTTSIFVKKNGLRYFALQAHDNGSGSGHRAGFDLDNGTVVTSNNMGSASNHSASIVEFPNGWFRCILTGTTASSGSTGKTAFSFSSALDGNASVGGITADGSSGGYVWGHQAEAGSYVSSYIPTTSGTEVTRGADLLLIDGDDSTALSDAYNDQEGTLVVEYHNVITDGSYVATIDDGSGNNRFGISNSNSSQGISVSGGLSQGQLDNGTPIVGATNKMAHAYKLNNRGLSLNGNDATQDNGFALPTGIRFIWIGCRAGSYDFLGSTISRFMYYTKRLPNSQLKLLTSQ